MNGEMLTSAPRDAALPPHVAKHGEPIQPLGERPWDGPDMRVAMSIDDMLAELAAIDDGIVYADHWRHLVTSVGCTPAVNIEKDGELSLTVMLPCDAQVRHRSRWVHFLASDLDRVQGRRAALLELLRRAGFACDHRPVDPRATTVAMRDFLLAEGRILVAPDGRVTEGGGAPSALLHGTAEEYGACAKATRAYFDLRNRFRADRHIRRAARMLGARTDNGWLVLEARS